MVHIEELKQATEYGVQGPKGVISADTRKAADEAAKKGDDLVVVKRNVGEWLPA